MLQGLTNIGNTCYMNSVLQMLYKLEELMIDIDSIYSNSKDNSFLITYYFMEIYFDMNNKKSKPDILNQFHQIICTHYPQFTTYQQQDAQEFLLALLDMLHQELRNPNLEKKPTLRGSIDEQLQQLKQYLNQETSPINKHFGSIVIQSCKCCNCGYLTQHLEVTFTQNVNISQGNIRDMLIEQYKSEEVEMLCERCKIVRKFKKQLNIVEQSRCLLIGINRYKKLSALTTFFTGQYMSKSNRGIELSQVIQIGNRNLQLCGIIDHQGNENKGHYRYYHRSEQDWVCLDDYKIYLLREQTIQKLLFENESSYILLYQ